MDTQNNMTTPDLIGDIRRRNLRALVARYKPANNFLVAVRRGSKAQGEEMIWSPGMLSAVTGPNPSRPVTERTARRIEKALGLPSGVLDTSSANTVEEAFSAPLPMSSPDRPAPRQEDTSTPAPSPACEVDDAKLMTEAMTAVMSVVDAYGNDAFNPGRHGRIVFRVFQHAKKTGAVDMDFVEGLIAVMHEKE